MKSKASPLLKDPDHRMERRKDWPPSSLRLAERRSLLTAKGLEDQHTPVVLEVDHTGSLSALSEPFLCGYEPEKHESVPRFPSPRREHRRKH